MAKRFGRPWAAATVPPLVAGVSVLVCLAAAGAEVERVAGTDAYRRLVSRLASPEMEGRGPGTEGISRARDLLVAEFKAIGLEPAFGESFTQALTIPGGTKIEEQVLALVGEGGAAGAALEPRKDFAAMGFSAGADFQGEAVFVGYSIADKDRGYDSYAGLPADALKGKVAVVLRYEPQDDRGVSRWTKRAGSWSGAAALRSKVDLAARRGAAAVLIVNPPAHDDGKADPVPGTGLEGKAKVPVLHLARPAWRRVLKAAGRDPDDSDAALRRAADDGEAKITALGIHLRGRVVTQRTTIETHNVAAVLPGRGTLADQTIVVGAHYDHLGYGGFASRTRDRVIHPGADDNASGTAGVVMLARRLARREAGAADGGPPRRAVLFACFTAEERGLLGSAHLVANLKDAGLSADQVAAMVNMDMIGRLRGDRLHVWGVESGDRLEAIVQGAAEGRGLRLLTSGPGFGPSDQSSFYRAKVPVLCFNTGVHGDLHAPSDTADKINAEGAVRVLGLVEAVVDALRSGEARVAYAPPKPGRRPFLGIQPDLDADDVAGCRLAEVVPDGPSAKAGLRAGDVVVAWEGKEIAGPQDLIVYLRHSQPGDQVALKVRRDGKTLDVTILLGNR